MVSRRRILSRSRDDLNLDSTYVMQEEEEDVWYQRDKLYKVSGTSTLQLIGFVFSLLTDGKDLLNFTHTFLDMHLK
jgi:hypothetical protein